MWDTKCVFGEQTCHKLSRSLSCFAFHGISAPQLVEYSLTCLSTPHLALAVRANVARTWAWGLAFQLGCTHMLLQATQEALFGVWGFWILQVTAAKHAW